MKPTLTAAEVADEIGRSTDWLYANWRRLVEEKKLPEPVTGRDGGELRWQSAQVYATLDRRLAVHLRPAAAAYRAAARAAEEAYRGLPTPDAEVEEAVQRLERKFGNRQQGGAQ